MNGRAGICDHRWVRGRGGRFDVLILGGGAAGCVLAARLSEDPRRRVALVEAGPDYGHLDEGRWPAALLDARVDGALTYLRSRDGEPDPHDWGFDAGLSGIRAKVIGGCSSHNGCEALWGSSADYDEWAAATRDPSWGYAGLAPHLARAHATLRARPKAERHLSAVRRALLAAAARMGMPLLPDLNAPDAIVGAGSIPVNAVGTLRWGAAFAYLDPARHRPNLRVIADTTVDRIVLRNGRALGAVVRASGARGGRPLEAQVVVVTAGSYNTPTILGRSGIGAADELRALGIDPVVDLPGVGRDLIDHPYVLPAWSARRRLEAADERHLALEVPLALSEIKWASSRCAPGSWDVSIGAWSGRIFDQRAHVDVHLAGLAPCAMKAFSRGRVTLRSADPAVLPAIDHGFLTDPDGHDLAVLAEGVEVCREVGASREWRHWCGPETSPGAAVRGEALVAWIRANAAGTYHPAGTCRMGLAGDPGAVVDAHGRVFGVENLVVADASIFPTIPAANIHLSVLAAAEKLAADLAIAPDRAFGVGR